jgi:hypothetical protein
MTIESRRKGANAGMVEVTETWKSIWEAAIGKDWETVFEWLRCDPSLIGDIVLENGDARNSVMLLHVAFNG